MNAHSSRVPGSTNASEPLLPVGALTSEAAPHEAPHRRPSPTLSLRDSRRTTLTQETNADAGAMRFLRERVMDAPIGNLIEREIDDDHRAAALTILVENPAFRRDPGRLGTLHRHLAALVDHARLSARHGDPAAARRRVGALLTSVIRFSGALHAWSDNPDLTPEQRALFTPEMVLPPLLSILGTDLSEPDVADPADRLDAITRRFIGVLNRMVDRGLLRKSRSDMVIRWCQLMALETTQAYRHADGRPCLPPALRERLANLKVRAVIFNILLDEVADDAQSRADLDRFLTIPFGDDGRLQPVPPSRRAQIAQAFASEWREYAELTIDVWNSFLAGLRATVGERAFARHADQLRDDYLDLMHSFQAAVRVNDGEVGLDAIGEDFEQVLAHNMNMMPFETMDRMALERVAPEVAARLDDPGAYAVAREISRLFQENAHRANTAATADAEIDENCAANEVISIAARSGSGQLLDHLYRRRRAALDSGDLNLCGRLADQIRHIVAEAGARPRLHGDWLATRRRIEALAASHPVIAQVLDLPVMLAANDAFFTLYVVFRGDI